MIETTGSQDLTIKDVVNGLESMERWTHQLREALATLDQEQRLDFKPRHGTPKQPPLVTGGVCAPPDTDRKPPRRGLRDTPTKPTTKPPKKKK